MERLKSIISIVVIIIALFLNTQIEYYFDSVTKMVYIAILPMIFYIAINILTQKLQYDRYTLYIILLAFTIIIFKQTIEQDYITRMLRFLITPMLISICYENFTKKDLTLLFRLFIVFYIVVCGLSLVEQILNRNLFITQDWVLEIFSDWNKYGSLFRSSSLLGHPLTNAQVVAVIMTFIAVSNFKRKYVQIILFFLGYVSLLCFGGRGAILTVTILVAPYFVWKVNKSTQPSKKWIIKLAVFFMFCGLVYAVTQTQLGSRLMGGELIDASAQTRLEVFNFYKYYQTNDDFLWGQPQFDRYILEIHGLPIENGVIVLLLDFGIIFTIPMLLLLFSFQYRKLSVYPKFEKWLLIAVFFIIGTMNPNLKDAVQWTMWINAYFAFRTLQTVNT